MMRNLILATASAALLAQAALADPAANSTAPLSPGKPAGVHRAQVTNTDPMLFAGLALLVIGGGIYLAKGTYKIPGSSGATSTTGTGR